VPIIGASKREGLCHGLPASTGRAGALVSGWSKGPQQTSAGGSGCILRLRILFLYSPVFLGDAQGQFGL
jgi:hypothetical protein